MKTLRIPVLPAAIAVAALGLLGMTAQGPLVSSVKSLTAEQAEILGHMSIVHLDDGQGGTCKTIRITGVNVQIVNGLNATNGNPGNPTTTANGQTVVNGVGNLIVGYNETQNPSLLRTGSHSIVVGRQNGYSSFGGLVSGAQNMAQGAHNTVCGGVNNVAGFRHSSILGGLGNSTTGEYSAIAGGGGVLISGANETGVGTLVIDP